MQESALRGFEVANATRLHQGSSACKHCGKDYTGNVTHLKEHLEKCRIFHKANRATVKEKNDTVYPLHKSKLAKSSQNLINFPRLSNSEKSDLDVQAAMWCFMGNHPF